MGRVVRPVLSRSGPIKFSEKTTNGVASGDDFRHTLRRRWDEARRDTDERDWITDMSYTITPQENKINRTPAAVEVPDDVAADLLGFWEYMEQNPNYSGHVKFDKAEEAEPFAAQARSWANAQNVANADGDKGPLIFRQLPSKGLPDTELRFSLSAQPTKAEAEAREADRAKRKAAREAAKAQTAEAAKAS